jgi:hypothetical protein
MQSLNKIDWKIGVRARERETGRKRKGPDLIKCFGRIMKTAECLIYFTSGCLKPRNGAVEQSTKFDRMKFVNTFEVYTQHENYKIKFYICITRSSTT